MAYTYKGKTYKTKALMQKAQGDVKGTPTKNKGSFFDKFIKGDKFKKKAPASNVDSGRGGKDSARQKKYDKASMFAKAADNRDKAKTTLGKARSFKEAFDDATKQGKDRFMLKGKSYLTTKGKRADRFPVTTDKKKPADKKESIFSKFKSSKTGSEFFKKLKKKK